MAIFSFTNKSLKREAPGRKTKSLEANDDGTVRADGVFVSARTLAMRPITPPSSAASSMSSSTGSSSDDDSQSSSSSHSSGPSGSLPTSWKSSGSTRHHDNAPLVVSDPDESEQILVPDEATRLGKVIARNRKLPGTWYFSSNHVLVNQERARRAMAPLVRMVELDLLARLHAQQMAEEEDLRHVQADALRLALQRIPHRRLGENVARGRTIRSIHAHMMDDETNRSNRNNIVDRRFTHFGMGTAVAANGDLYLCQIFRG